ncbi:MAG: tryptophan synthase subunit alpha [Bradymonadaceae bacterium]|nr:tryptophan synthase subunit alpha [Lujinxingiaceae bacterium]
MSQRLEKLESDFAADGRPLLMGALVAGDPHVEATLKYMSILAEQGVDIIELIVPFSDPTYHGPVIQRACARAIHEDVGWSDICELAARFRERFETPIVASSYFNRFLAMGLENCARQMSAAGVDAVMIADLPWDESQGVEQSFAAHGIAIIRSVAPTTSTERFQSMAEGARGFIVWTGHSGGEVTISTESFKAAMAGFHQHTQLPIIASMKVSTGEEAAEVGEFADGVLVGSALVWLIEGRGADLSERIRRFVDDLRRHLRP